MERRVTHTHNYRVEDEMTNTYNYYEDFESLENVEKSSYVLGSELWESKFNGLLALVKEYIVYRCLGNTKTLII